MMQDEPSQVFGTNWELGATETVPGKLVARVRRDLWHQVMQAVIDVVASTVILGTITTSFIQSPTPRMFIYAVGWAFFVATWLIHLFVVRAGTWVIRAETVPERAALSRRRTQDALRLCRFRERVFLGIVLLFATLVPCTLFDHEALYHDRPASVAAAFVGSIAALVLYSAMSKRWRARAISDAAALEDELRAAAASPRG
jgi:uncharacterized membrane protein